MPHTSRVSRSTGHETAAPFRGALGAPAPDAEPVDALRVSTGRPAPQLLVLRVLGDVDLRTAPLLAWHLRHATDITGKDPGGGLPGWAPTVVCDLTGVEFLSAAGISVLVEADERAGARGAVLVVVASDHVTRVLRLTEADHRLRLCTHLGQAHPATALIPAATGRSTTAGGGTEADLIATVSTPGRP